MPNKWGELHVGIKLPDFSDREMFLKALGLIVIDEIVNMIERREQPDGSPQKENSEGYRRAKKRLKGYDTPLKGISSESPYIAKDSKRHPAWVRQFVAPDTLHIYLNSRRWQIGYELQEKGYWFMGITMEAERLMSQRASNYFRSKKYQMMGKKFG